MKYTAPYCPPARSAHPLPCRLGLDNCVSHRRGEQQRQAARFLAVPLLLAAGANACCVAVGRWAAGGGSSDAVQTASGRPADEPTSETGTTSSSSLFTPYFLFHSMATRRETRSVYIAQCFSSRCALASRAVRAHFWVFLLLLLLRGNRTRIPRETQRTLDPKREGSAAAMRPLLLSGHTRCVAGHALISLPLLAAA